MLAGKIVTVIAASLAHNLALTTSNLEGTVYDNTVNRLPLRYSSPFEFGDQIILEGPNRFLTNFVLELGVKRVSVLD